MNIIQVAVLGVVGILFAVYLKQEKGEVAIYLCVVVSLLIFFGILDSLGVLVDTIREIGSYIQIDVSYIGTLIKMLGITYLAEFSSGLCKDAGYQAIAVQIELFGKVTILVLSLPILLTLLRTIQEFLS
jgi:stage III sporulation protein AD